MTSYWIDRADDRSAPPSPFAPPDQVLEGGHDVVVVGAGIVGATAALELVRGGCRVLLLDAAAHPARGVTGQSTAKVTVGHGLRLSEVRSSHGDQAAHEYAAAARRGLAHVRDTAAGLAVASESAPHDLYTTEPLTVPRLEAHAADAEAMGLEVLHPSVVEAGTPVAACGVVRYPDQILLDPVAYVTAVVGEAQRLGADVRLGVVAHGIDEGPPIVVHTDRGEVLGRQVLLATHAPFPLRTLAFAVSEQRRHYALAGAVPRALTVTYDVGAGWSTRPVSGTTAVVVGPGDVTGRGNETDRMRSLRRWATGTVGLEVTHAWSTQDVFTSDGLPMCGRAGLRGDLWVATGFGGWGLTSGSAAALDVAHRILDGGPGEVASWSPRRASLVSQARPTARSLAATVVGLGRSVVPRPPTAPERVVAELAPGQGRVVHSGTRKVAVSRDLDGVVRGVSARCTHLGCLVGWNAEAQSWDCPCHGSRFGPDGAVRHGPACRALPALPTT